MYQKYAPQMAYTLTPIDDAAAGSSEGPTAAAATTTAATGAAAGGAAAAAVDADQGPLLSVPVVGQVVMEVELETLGGHSLFQVCVCICVCGEEGRVHCAVYSYPAYLPACLPCDDIHRFPNLNQLDPPPPLPFTYTTTQTYLLSRPLLEDSFLRLSQRRAQEQHRNKGGQNTDPLPDTGSFSTRQLAINVFRVRRALQPPPLLLLLLDHPLPLFHPWFLLLAWKSPLWPLPLHLLLLSLLNGLLAAQTPTSGFASVEAWPEPLVERVMQLEGTSAPAKLRKLRRMVKWLQDQLGLLASGLERCVDWVVWVRGLGGWVGLG